MPKVRRLVYQDCPVRSIIQSNGLISNAPVTSAIENRLSTHVSVWIHDVVTRKSSQYALAVVKNDTGGFEEIAAASLVHADISDGTNAQTSAHFTGLRIHSSGLNNPQPEGQHSSLGLVPVSLPGGGGVVIGVSGVDGYWIVGVPVLVSIRCLPHCSRASVFVPS